MNMKASELIQKLWWSIAKNGDGPVCIAGLDTCPEINALSDQGRDEHNKPVYLLYTEGPPLMETPDTDQSIRDEIDEIGREIEL